MFCCFAVLVLGYITPSVVASTGGLFVFSIEMLDDRQSVLVTEDRHTTRNRDFVEEMDGGG